MLIKNNGLKGYIKKSVEVMKRRVKDFEEWDKIPDRSMVYLINEKNKCNKKYYLAGVLLICT